MGILRMFVFPLHFIEREREREPMQRKVSPDRGKVPLSCTFSTLERKEWKGTGEGGGKCKSVTNSW
jgi:hypothetical protein